MSITVTRKCVLQVLLFIAASTVSFGNGFSLTTTWTLEHMILTPRCGNSSNSNGTCCSSCLGFSIFEYNFMLSFSRFLAVVSVLTGAAAINRFGVGAPIVATLLVVLTGNILQTFGAWFGNNKMLSLALMISGRCLYTLAEINTANFRQYIVMKYFPEQYRQFGIACGLAIVNLGYMCGQLVSNRNGRLYGLTYAFGVMSAVCVFPVVSGVTILRTIKQLEILNPELVSAEVEWRKQSICTRLKDLSALFEPHALLIMTCLLTANTNQMGFEANSIEFFFEMFGVSPARTAHFTAVGHLMNAIAVPICGIIAIRFSYRSVWISVASFAGVLVMVLLLTTNLNPMYCPVVIGFIGGVTTPPGCSLLSIAVPAELLPNAIGLITAVIQLSMAILSFIAGYYVNNMVIRAYGWILWILMFMSFYGIQLGCALVIALTFKSL